MTYNKFILIFNIISKQKENRYKDNFTVENKIDFILGLVILSGGLLLVIYGFSSLLVRPYLPELSWEQGSLRVESNRILKGIEKNDLIVKIDDVYLRNYRWPADIEYLISGGKIHNFQILRGGKRIEISTYVPRKHSNALLAICLLTSLSFLGVSLLMLLKRCNKSVLKLITANAAIAILISILEPYTFGTRLSFWFFFYLAPGLIFRLLGIVTEESGVKQKLRIIGKFIISWGVFVSMLTIVTLVSHRLRLTFYQKYYSLINIFWNTFTTINGVIILLVVILSFTLPLFWVRTLRTKRKLQWVLWGIAGAVSPYLFGLYIPYYILNLYGASTFETALTITIPFFLLIPASTTIAILRYRLFNIEVIIQKSLVYLLTLSIITIGAVVLIISTTDFIPSSNINKLWFYMIVAIAGILLFIPLRRKMQNLVAGWFSHYDYNILEVIENFSYQLPGLNSNNQIIETACRLVKRFLIPNFVTVATQDSDGKIHYPCSTHKTILPSEIVSKLKIKDIEEIFLMENNVIIVRITPPDYDPAWLILGPKVNGQRYTEKDHQLIKVMSSQLRGVLDLMDYSPENTSKTLNQIERFRKRIAKLREERDRYQQMAVTDHLTGFYNRRYLEKALRSELNRYERFDESFGVLAVDLDHFKKINDNFGHKCGDLVLITVSSNIENSVRATDTPCRIGGDEFMLLLPHIDREELYEVGEKIRNIVKKSKVSCNEQNIVLTASIGAALISPSYKGNSIDYIIQRADRALYYAKKNSRNQTVLYSDLPPGWKL